MKYAILKLAKICQLIVLTLLLASGNLFAGQTEAIQKVKVFLAQQKPQGSYSPDEFNAFHQEINKIIASEYPGPPKPGNMDLLRAARMDAEKNGWGWFSKEANVSRQFSDFEKGLDSHRIKLAQDAKKHALIEVYAKYHNASNQAEFMRGLAGTGDVGSWSRDQAVMDWKKDIDYTLDHLDPKIAGELQAAADKYILDTTGATHLDLDIVATGTGHERKAGVYGDKSSRHLVDQLLLEAGGNVAESIEFVRNSDGSFDIKKTPLTAKQYLKRRFHATLMTQFPTLADAEGKFNQDELAKTFREQDSDSKALKKQIMDFIQKEIRLKGASSAYGVVEMLAHAEGEGRGQFDLETAFEKGGKYLKRALVFLQGGEGELSHVYQSSEFETIQKKLEFGEKITGMKNELSSYKDDLSKKTMQLADQTPGSGQYKSISQDIEGINDKIKQIEASRDQAAAEFFKLIDPDGGEFQGYEKTRESGDADKWVQKYLDANRDTLIQISSLVVEQSVIDVMKLEQNDAMLKLQEFKQRFDDMVMPHTFDDGTLYHGLQDQPGSDKNTAWAQGISDAYANLMGIAENKAAWDALRRQNSFLVTQFTSLSNYRDVQRVLPEDPSKIFHKDLAENKVGQRLTESLGGLQQSMAGKARGIPAMLGMVHHLQQQAEISMGTGRMTGLTALSQLDMALSVLDNIPMDGSLPTLEQSKNLVMVVANMYIPYLGAINAIGEGRDTDIIMREIVYIFCPLASAPDVVKSLGTRAIATARTFAFDSQLQVIYANSEFSTPKEGEPQENFQPKFLRMHTKNNDYQGLDGVEGFIRAITEGTEERGSIFDQSKLARAEGGIVTDAVTGLGYLADSAVILAFQSVVNTGEHKLFREDPVLAQLTQEYSIQLQLIAETKAYIKENSLRAGSMEHRRLRFLEEGILVKDGKEVKEDALIAKSARGLQDRIIKRLAQAIVQTFEARARNEGFTDEEGILELDTALVALAQELRLEKPLLAPEKVQIDASNEAKTFFGRRAIVAVRNVHSAKAKAVAAASDAEKRQFNALAVELEVERKQAVGDLVQAHGNYKTVLETRQFILTQAQRFDGITVEKKGSLSPLTGLGALTGDPVRDLNVAIKAKEAFANLYESVATHLEYSILEGREALFGLVTSEDSSSLQRTRYFALLDQIVLAGENAIESIVWGKVIALNLPAEAFAEHVIDECDIGGEGYSWWDAFNEAYKQLSFSPADAVTKALFGVDESFEEQLRKDYLAARQQAKQRLTMTAQRYWQKAYDIREKMSQANPLQIVLSFKDKDIGSMPLENEVSFIFIDPNKPEEKIPVAVGLSHEDDTLVYSSSVSAKHEYLLTVQAKGFPEKKHGFSFKDLKSLPQGGFVAKAPADSIFPSLDVDARQLVLVMDEAGNGLPLFDLVATLDTYDGPPITATVLQDDILAFQAKLDYFTDKENVRRRVIWSLVGPDGKEVAGKSATYGKDGDVEKGSYSTSKKQEDVSYDARFRFRLTDMEEGEYKVTLRHEIAEDPKINAEAEYVYVISGPKLEISQLIVSHSTEEKEHMREMKEITQDRGRYIPSLHVAQKAYVFLYFTMPEAVDEVKIRFIVSNPSTQEVLFTRDIERRRNGESLRQRVGIPLDWTLIQSNAALGVQAAISGPDKKEVTQEISFEAKVAAFEINQLIVSNYTEETKHQEETRALSNRPKDTMTVIASDKEAYFYIYYALPMDMESVNVRWTVVDSAGQTLLSGETERIRTSAALEQRMGISGKTMVQSKLPAVFQATLISEEGQELTRSIPFRLQQPPVVIQEIFVASTPDGTSHDSRITLDKAPHLNLRFVPEDTVERADVFLRLIETKTKKTVFEKKFDWTMNNSPTDTFYTAAVAQDALPLANLYYSFEATILADGAKPVQKARSFSYGTSPSLKGLLKVTTHFDTQGSEKVTVEDQQGARLTAKPNTRIHYEAHPVYPRGLNGDLGWTVTHADKTVYSRKISLDGTEQNWDIQFQPKNLKDFDEGSYFVKLIHKPQGEGRMRPSEGVVFSGSFSVTLPFSASIVQPEGTSNILFENKDFSYITKLDIKGLALEVKTREFSSNLTIQAKASVKGTSIILADGEKTVRLEPETSKTVEWPMKLHLINFDMWSKFQNLKSPEDYFKTIEQEFTITDENGLTVTKKGEYKVYVAMLSEDEGHLERIDNDSIFYSITPPQNMKKPVTVRISEGLPYHVEGTNIMKWDTSKTRQMMEQGGVRVSDSDEETVYEKIRPMLIEVKDSAGVNAYKLWPKFTYTFTYYKNKSE